jgi:hypothetical protein
LRAVIQRQLLEAERGVRRQGHQPTGAPRQ